MSASRPSPGPLTAQPITAILIGAQMPETAFFNLLRQRQQIDLAAPAGRAGDHFRAVARAPTARRMSSPAVTSSTGSAARDTRIVSPIPMAKQTANPSGALYGSHAQRTRVRDAQMKRVIAAPGHIAVRRNRGGHVGRL